MPKIGTTSFKMLGESKTWAIHYNRTKLFHFKEEEVNSLKQLGFSNYYSTEGQLLSELRKAVEEYNNTFSQMEKVILIEVAVGIESGWVRTQNGRHGKGGKWNKTKTIEETCGLAFSFELLHKTVKDREIYYKDKDGNPTTYERRFHEVMFDRRIFVPYSEARLTYLHQMRDRMNEIAESFVDFFLDDGLKNRLESGELKLLK